MAHAPQNPIGNTEMAKGRKKETNTKKEGGKLEKPNDKNQTSIKETGGKIIQNHTHSVRDR